VLHADVFAAARQIGRVATDEPGDLLGKPKAARLVDEHAVLSLDESTLRRGLSLQRGRHAEHQPGGELQHRLDVGATMAGGSLAGHVSSRASSNRFSRRSSQSGSGARSLSFCTGFFELDIFATFQRCLFYQRMAASKVPELSGHGALPPPLPADRQNFWRSNSLNCVAAEMLEDERYRRRCAWLQWGN